MILLPDGVAALQVLDHAAPAALFGSARAPGRTYMDKQKVLNLLRTTSLANSIRRKMAVPGWPRLESTP